MICSKCNEKAVFLDPKLCKKHFVVFFEKKVLDTIKKFNLVKKNDKIIVACSGGKDSTTILYLLNKYFGNVAALAIDEGIANYRDKTLVDLKSFCSKHKIPLKIHSFKKEVGNTLDVMLKKKNHPCTICGTFRRYLLNKYAKAFDKIATGHNMDDEAQAVLMNLLKGNVDLLWNSTPITPNLKGFVQKIKPLYFCSEKEVAAYAFLMNFDVGFSECPYIGVSFRHSVRKELNEYSLDNKNVKLNILNKHLKVLESINPKKKGYSFCKVCCESSRSKTCKACELIQSFK